MRRAPVVLLFLTAAACSSSELPSPTDPDELVIFRGANAIPSSELLELVTPDINSFDGATRRGALEDAAYRIEYRYRLAGFDRVTVTPRIEGKKVVFLIDEGARILLAQVHFEGATLFTTDQLRELTPKRFLGSLPPYSRRSVILMEDSLIAAYRDRGYRDVLVSHRTALQDGYDDRMVVWFMIQEGAPYTVTELRGLPPDSGLQEKTRDILGRAYSPGTPENVEAVIVDYYREHGHPFTTARVRPQIDQMTGTVILEVELRLGPQAALKEMKVSGAVWTREQFILSRADLKPGEEYRMSELRHAEERLMATNVFKRVRVSPSASQEETTKLPIEIEVEEREGGEASVQGGYGSFDGPRIGADV